MARHKHPKYKTDLFLYAALNRPAIVYIARNLKNGNCYIGVTRTTLDARRKKHLGEVSRGTRGRFYNAIRKYGAGAFEWSVIKECTSYYEALAEEVSQINCLNPAYNVTRGGEGALGLRHSRATREKMRVAKIGKPHPGLGKKRSHVTIEKMRAAALAKPTRYWLGKKRDQATIDKIRATKQACPPSMDWVTPEMKAALAERGKAIAAARRRYVKCLNDGKVYLGTKAAAQAYGLRPNAVAVVCNPKKHNTTTVYGYRFVYLEGP
jgi:group I intron endonuclease